MGKKEDPVHKGVLNLMRLRLPGALIHHSANEMNVGAFGGDEATKKQLSKSKAIAQARAKELGMEPGFPDLMALWNSRFYAFEVKAPGKKPTQAQIDVGETIHRNGGFWAAVDDVWQADELLVLWLRMSR